MRNTFIILLSLVLSCVAVGCASKVATVTLSVSSKDSVTFYQWRPLQGVSSIQTDTIKVIGDTVLTQQIQIDGLAQYSIFSPSVGSLSLLLGQAEVVVLTYDADSVGGFRVDDSSSNAAAQRLYNKLSASQNVYKYEWVRDYSVAPLDTSGYVMYDNFRALAAADLAPFEKLLDKGLASREFVYFVSMDIDHYYALSMAKVVRGNVMDNLENEGTQPRYEGYGELFGDLWKKYPITVKSVRSNNARQFAMIYADYHNVVNDTNAKMPNFESKSQYLNWKKARILSLSADEQVVRPLLAQFIWREAINNKNFDAAVDSMIVEFNDQFKENQYSRYYDRFLREGRRYRDIIEKPFSDKVVFIADTTGVTTLAQIIDKFRGKNLYIDFWFHSCAPCRAEFKYSSAVHKFLKQNDITPLFVSVDQPQMRQNWLDAIKYHNLEGFHICVNRQTFVDMDKNYDINSFPRYMIVDKNGVIVQANAKAPSSGEELFTQLKNCLNLNSF